MRRTITFVVAPLLMLSGPLAFSQSRLEFEVASIRSFSPSTNDVVTAGLHIDGSQVSFNSFSLKDYVSFAYRMKINQVVGPDWIAGERFNIVAKMVEGASTDKVPEMMQNLLADRFEIKTHKDKKEFTVYALLVDKGGLKLTEGPPDPELFGEKGTANVAAGGSGQGVAINFGKGSYFTLGATQLEVKKLPMQMFADMLTRFLDRPVVDMTETKGTFDLTLDLSQEDRNAMLIRSAIAAGVSLPAPVLRAIDLSSGDSLTNALQKVGLRLDSRKAPLDVIVVDSMRKTPTEN